MATDQSPCVLIVDGHRVFQECLCWALSKSEKLSVSVTMDHSEGLSKEIRDGRPDILVVSVNVTKARVLDILDTVSKHLKETKVLVLGINQLEAVEYIEAGASGYVPKDESLSFLISAIDRVRRGEIVIPSHILPQIFSRLSRLSREQLQIKKLRTTTLTSRELEVLGLIAEGLSNQEIALRLHLSLYTVKNHVHNILEKLSVESRMQAVACAQRQGWLIP